MTQTQATIAFGGVFAGTVGILLLTFWFAPQAQAGDPAADVNTALQKARSRMMSMQIDQAVELFQDATQKLTTLKQADPGNAQLGGLEQKHAKLATDLAKKVVQRAGRDINPMKSGLEAALRGTDAAKIETARAKLKAAVEKHRANLVAAGGDAGAALLASADALLVDGGEPTPPEPKPGPKEETPPPPRGGGDAKAIHDELQRIFRSARSMDTKELVAEAPAIRALIEELKAAEPTHPRIASFEQKLEKMVADAYASDVRAARNEIDRRISRIEMYLERNQENERPQLKEQRDLLAKALTDHRAALEAAGAEGQALITRTETAVREADAKIGVALAGDSLVGEWVQKLEAYTRGGDKDITPGINGAALYAKVKEWRAEAAALWETYQKVTFEKGKTSELERQEHFLQESMEEADRNLAYAVDSRLKGVQGKLANIERMFAGDRAWQQGGAAAPTRFADELLDDAARSLADLVEYVPDHGDIATFRAEHGRLLKENQERRNAAKTRTFLKADRYQGKDAAALKAFATKRVPKDHPGAKALRLTLFTPEWKEETVVEWTDTSRTAIRKRTTRTLMFCVAFEDGEGVFRDFGYLNQNRSADGTWGPIYGHCAKFRAPMLKANVGKDEAD